MHSVNTRKSSRERAAKWKACKLFLRDSSNRGRWTLPERLIDQRSLPGHQIFIHPFWRTRDCSILHDSKFFFLLFLFLFLFFFFSTPSHAQRNVAFERICLWRWLAQEMRQRRRRKKEGERETVSLQCKGAGSPPSYLFLDARDFRGCRLETLGREFFRRFVARCLNSKI